MADYNVKFTDLVNKGTLSVEENSVNVDDTSLQLPGQNLPNYGQIVNENFLHLLENFANNVAPSNPVEGQLWYDTTTGVDQLKVYDGTNWIAAGGIKKAISEPEAAISIIGDLWVDTTNQQVYLYSGSGWVLVGPDYSEGASTGSKIQSLEATDGLLYTVLVNFVNGEIICIYSSKEFTPKAKQAGFPTAYTIKPGVNLATQGVFSGAKAKYYGTAEKAESLINSAGTETIAYTDIARLSKSNDFSKKTRIKTDSGITVGENDLLQLSVSGSTALIRQLSPDGNIDIKVNDSGINSTALRITPQGQLGVKNEAPTEALDVTGNIRTSGKVFVDSTINSISSSDGALTVAGGIGVARDVNISGLLNVGSDITAGEILPAITETHNIGTSAKKYNNMYANTFNGNLVGSVTGNVSGTSTSTGKLASPTTFQFNTNGDVVETQASPVVFDGQVGGTTKQWTLGINPAFISTKPEITIVNETADEFLVNRSGVLYKMKQSTLVGTVPTFQKGMLMPFAGTVSPAGWAFCHGQELPRGGEYEALYDVIGDLYGTPSNADVFKVPDFRGRMLAGHVADATSGNRILDDTATEVVGRTGGAESTAITVDNLPDHEHSLQGDNGEQYYATTGVTGGTDTGATATSITGSAPGTSIAQTGAMINQTGDPLQHVPPFVTVEYIIYTGVV